MSCGSRIADPGEAFAPPTQSGEAETAKARPVIQAEASKGLPQPAFLYALLLTCIGSVLGILGVLQSEAPSGFLVPWLWAPILEEVFKPAGVYLILVKWPKSLENQLYTACLGAVAGLAFGLVESTAYVYLYVSDPSSEYVAFRYSIPVAMHGLFSFVFGLGINQRLWGTLSGDARFSIRNWGFFAAAMAMHSIYNITVTIVDIEF